MPSRPGSGAWLGLIKYLFLEADQLTGACPENLCCNKQTVKTPTSTGSMFDCRLARPNFSGVGLLRCCGDAPSPGQHIHRYVSLVGIAFQKRECGHTKAHVYVLEYVLDITLSISGTRTRMTRVVAVVVVVVVVVIVAVGLQ